MKKLDRVLFIPAAVSPLKNGDDLAPKGQFRKMTGVASDETVVFSWILYRSKAHRNAVNKKVMAEMKGQSMPDSMPFDVKRMAYGGFKTLVQG